MRATSASREYNLTAVTVGRRDVGEKDMLLTLFSLEAGRVNVAVRGTKKTVSTLRGATQLFSMGECLVVSRRGSDLLTEWIPITSFPGIKTSLEKISLAGYMARCATELSSVDHADRGLFHLFENIFFILQSNTNYDIMKLIFDWGFLETSGQAFSLEHCITCGCNLDGMKRVRIDVAEGGLFCPECSGGFDLNDSLPVARETIEFGKEISLIAAAMRGDRLSAGDAAEVSSAINSAAAPALKPVAAKLAGIVGRFMQYHIHEKVSAWLVKL